MRSRVLEMFGAREGHHATPGELSIVRRFHPRAVLDLPAIERFEPVPEPVTWTAADFRQRYPDGAVGSGNVLATASVEVARPISARLPSLWGAVFVDAGNAANTVGELKPAVGYGLGVRWRSPVGPLRVDWAWARETGKGRLHFSVGIAF